MMRPGMRSSSIFNSQHVATGWPNNPPNNVVMLHMNVVPRSTENTNGETEKQGSNEHFNLHFRVNSLFHHLCSQCYAAQHSYVPLLSLRRDSPSNRPRLSLSDLVARSADLIRRSWVRFPPRSKDFFFTSCGSLIPFTRANAQWVIHGFKWHFNLHFRVNSLFHH